MPCAVLLFSLFMSLCGDFAPHLGSPPPTSPDQSIAPFSSHGLTCSLFWALDAICLGQLSSREKDNESINQTSYDSDFRVGKVTSDQGPRMFSLSRGGKTHLPPVLLIEFAWNTANDCHLHTIYSWFPAIMAGWGVVTEFDHMTPKA